MKPNINSVINKLITYAFDNLLLDPLDETYTINRIATACAFDTPVRDEDIDYGSATLGELLAELKAVCPAADIAAVKNALIPMPRTASMYFNDALDRSPEKGFDFLYGLYAHCDCGLEKATAYEKDGYTAYVKPTCDPPEFVAIDGAAYVPISGSRVAKLQAEDILAEDVLAREAAFVNAYGGAVAYRFGDEAYLTAPSVALAQAAVKKVISESPVKVTLLDYPVAALAFNGVAKNAVAREVTRVINAAKNAELDFAVAAAAKDGITYYIVFAKNVAPDEYVLGGDSLAACGVYSAPDCSGLLSVLEKGTALSTDLAAFKPIYDVIGGVKHGNKATTVLGGFLADKFKTALAAASTASAEQAEALVKQDA